MKFVTDKSKGILGSPDSVELWTQIIDQIPDSLLLKPGLRILNIACGHCTEAVILANRMLALGVNPSEVQKSFTLLDKYQVFTNPAKMLYGFENVITADFLTWRDANPMERFDIVLGNPPYQGNHEKDSESARKVGNKLWYQFVFEANSLVAENGYVAMVTPNQWCSGGVNMRKGNLGVMKDIFSKKQLVVANMSDVTERYFSNIGIDIGWWIYKNAPIESESKFILKDGEVSLNLSSTEFLTPDATKIGFSLVKKILYSNDEKFQTYYFNTQCKEGSYSETEIQTEVNKYPHWIQGSTVTKNECVWYFPKPLSQKVNFKKIVFSMSTRYWQPDLLDSGVNVATLGQSLTVPADTTPGGFESVFYSKVFRYLCYNLQISQNGFMKSSYVKSLPKLDMSRVWTDAEIYEHFGLTLEEIEYVESNVK